MADDDFFKPLLQRLFSSAPRNPTAPVVTPATPAAGGAKPVAEVTTPNTANRPTPQAEAELLAKRARIAAQKLEPASGTTAFFTSIEGAINAVTDKNQNCLNAYFQSTYHFRLFMAEDGTVIHRTGATTIQALNAALATNTFGMSAALKRESQGVVTSSVRQITIAESGVTGFNIKDVSFTTVVAGNPVTRGDTASNFVITITEPMGVGFLDAMIGAGKVLGVKNYTKAPFYLQLTFLGYDDKGNFVGDPADSYNTGGTWTWSLTCQNIEVKMNEAGAVYTCKFMAENTAYIRDEYDITRSPASFHAVGNTVGAIFESFRTQLNDAWVAKHNGPLVVFDEILTSDCANYFPFPASAQGKDPKTFSLIPLEKEKNTNRSWKLVGLDTYSVNVTPGYTVSEFILDAIKHTAEGQALAKGEPIPTVIDKGPGQVNDNNVREVVGFVVEPILKITHFDRTSGNYQKHLQFVVSPAYSQAVTLGMNQVDAGKPTDVQSRMVNNLLANGLFRKRYDYLFTGLNTEIISFDLNWNLQYNNTVGNYNGAYMNINAFHVPARRNSATSQPKSNSIETTERNTVDLVPIKNDDAAPDSGPPAPAPFYIAGRLSPGPATAEAAKPANNIYFEDLLSQQTAEAGHEADFAVPQSFWQGNYQVEHETGGGSFPGQYTTDLSVVGSVFNQIYMSSIATQAFQSAKLTIRGDPFWLGQTNLHRQLILLKKELNVKGQPLPNHTTGQQVIYLHFRYPTGISGGSGEFAQQKDSTTSTGDDFIPNLTPSLAFNGLYTVSKITHSFVDGVYKQELDCIKLNLADPSHWSGVTAPASKSASASTGTGGAESSAQQVGTSGPVPPADGVRASTTGLQQTGSFVDKAPGLTQRLMDDYHLTNEQASGIVGNLGHESGGLKTDIVERGGGGGYGLAQWTGVRRERLNQYAQQHGLPVGSMDAQYGYLKSELDGPERRALAAVRATTTIEGSTTAFQNGFERPASATASIDRRIALAKQASTLTANARPITVASNP